MSFDKFSLYTIGTLALHDDTQLADNRNRSMSETVAFRNLQYSLTIVLAVAQIASPALVPNEMRVRVDIRPACSTSYNRHRLNDAQRLQILEWMQDQR